MSGEMKKLEFSLPGTYEVKKIEEILQTEEYKAFSLGQEKDKRNTNRESYILMETGMKVVLGNRFFDDYEFGESSSWVEVEIQYYGDKEKAEKLREIIQSQGK